jgi:hypothetical protein
MFLAFIILLSIIPLVFWNKINKRNNNELFTGWAIIISIVFLLIHAVTYVASLSTIAEMKAFHTNNQTVYKQAVEEFPDSGRTVTGGDTTSVYLLSYDMAKAIIKYNTRLTWYHSYQDHWFLGGFVGKVPDNLKYISVQE